MSGISLISKKFSEMPVWVQVFTYLVLLGLYIYLLLCPRFINGQIVARTEHGGIVPYRGVNMQVSVEGRLLKFKTNESGFWSVPVISRLPESMRIQIYHEDERAWHEVVLSTRKIWKKDDFRIEITDEKPWIKIEQIAALPTGFDPPALGTGPGEAVAAELIIPKQAAANAVEKVNRDQIDKEVRNSVFKATGINAEAVNDNFPLSGKEAPSYVERIQIVEDIERNMDIKIPDEHWRELGSIGQLVDYIHNRKLLESYRPELYKSDNINNWAIIQQRAPENQRPVFIPTK